MMKIQKGERAGEHLFGWQFFFRGSKLFLGTAYSTSAYVSLLPLTIGGLASTYGEINFSAAGLALLVTGLLARVGRGLLSDGLSETFVRRYIADFNGTEKE